MFSKTMSCFVFTDAELAGSFIVQLNIKESTENELL